MEPFVPEPEERISATESGSAKGKGARNGHSVEYAEARPSGLKAQVPLIAVTLGLSALMFVSHSGKNAEIEDLSAQVASLKAEVQQSVQAATAQSGEDQPVPSGDYAGRLTSLEKLVADQVSELETMREMVAETLSKLDSDLEGSLMGYYERNRQAIEQLKREMASIAKLQAGVQEVQNTVKTLSAATEKTPRQDPQLAEKLTKLESQLASQSKELTSASQSGKQAMERLAKLDARLSAQDDGLAAATQAGKQSGDRLAALDKSLKSLESKLAESQKQIGDLKAGTGEDSQALAAVRQANDKSASQLQALRSSLDQLQTLTDKQGKTLAQLATEDKSLSQSLAAVKQDVTALDGKLGAKVSRDDLTKANAATQDSVKQLQTKVTELGGGVTAIREDVAALDGKLATKVSRDDLNKANAATQDSVKQLQAKVTDVTGSLTAIREDLAARDKQLSQLRTQVAQGAKAPPAAGSKAVAPVSDGGQLAVQLEAVKELESAQKLLAQDLSKTQAQLTSLSKELKADLAKVSAAKPSASASSADLSGLNKQLTSLTVQVAQTESKLKNQQSEFETWKRDVDQNLAGTSLRLNALSDASNQGGPQLQTQVDHILATIKILKKQHPYTEFP